MSGPPLEDGEDVVFDHIPSHAAFRRTAILLLGVTLLPTVVMAAVFPDTIWPAVPLFAACVILMQERVWLGRYRAWITNRRIIRQKGEDVPLWDVTAAEPARNSVRVRTTDNARGIKLIYAPDGAALAAAIFNTTTCPSVPTTTCTSRSSSWLAPLPVVRT